jgi:hypothetical protein
VWNVEKKVVIAALGADHWTTAVPDKKGVNIHSLTFYDSYTVHHKLISTVLPTHHPSNIVRVSCGGACAVVCGGACAVVRVSCVSCAR